MGKTTRITNFTNDNTTKGNIMCRKFVLDIRKKSKKIDDMPARAQDVLDYFQISDLSSGVPIVEILSKMGFKIYQSNLEPDGLSAYIGVDPKFEEIFDSNKIACVNIKDSIGDKRFALAHELAHYIFDFDDEENLYYYDTYFHGNDEKTTAGRRANKFAINLLMPKEAFQKMFEKYKELQSKADIVNALARYFFVSSTAVLERLNELGVTGYDINLEK